MINSHLILMWNTSDCWSKDVLPPTGPRNAAAFFQWRLLQHLCCRTRVHAHGMSSMSMICRCWLEPQHWSNTHPIMDFASLPLASHKNYSHFRGSAMPAGRKPKRKPGPATDKVLNPRCVAVYSNTFLYNMKANQDLKKYFWWKTTRWFFWGVLSCFRGTATYVTKFFGLPKCLWSSYHSSRSSWFQELGSRLIVGRYLVTDNQYLINR